MALQDRARMTWLQIKMAGRHGLGSENITKGQIRATIPEAFRGTDQFMALRYHDKLPMVGVRVKDVFHVLWIEARYGDVYPH